MTLVGILDEYSHYKTAHGFPLADDEGSRGEAVVNSGLVNNIATNQQREQTMSRHHRESATWKPRIAAYVASTIISGTVCTALLLVVAAVDDWPAGNRELALIAGYLLALQAIALVPLALFRRGPNATSGAWRVYAVYAVMLGINFASQLDGDHIGDLIAATGILLIAAVPASLLCAALYNWSERAARSSQFFAGVD